MSEVTRIKSYPEIEATYASNSMYIFFSENLKTIKRVQNVLIVIICTSVLAFQIGQCSFKYLDKETGTADKYVHVSNTSFPELTVCPTYPYRSVL